MATSQEELNFCGAQRIHWLEVGQIERSAYKNRSGNIAQAKKVVNTLLSSQKTEKKPEEYRSPRTKFNLPESAKLSIAPLFQENAPNAKLREIATHLIRVIYETTSLYRFHLEEEVLATLIKVGRANPTITTFQELFPKVEKDHLLYYKLCKGTQRYDLFTNNGYPALGDFFTLANRTPVLMSRASKPLLVVLFGEQFTHQLMEKERILWKEKEKHQPLKKEEIEMLYLKVASGKNLSEFEGLLDYNQHDRHRKQRVFYDEKSNIQLRMRS